MSDKFKVLETLIRGNLNPCLKQAGFHKKGKVWNRSNDEFTDVFEIQAGRWNSNERSEFTIVVGIFLPSIHELLWGREKPVSVRESDCQLRRRLSHLRQEKQGLPIIDSWWVIDQDENDKSTIDDIIYCFKQFALPFFSAHHSLSSISQVLETSGKWEDRTPFSQIVLAILRAKLNDRINAELILKNVRIQFPSWEETVTSVLNRLDIKQKTS